MTAPHDLFSDDPGPRRAAEPFDADLFGTDPAPNSPRTGGFGTPSNAAKTTDVRQSPPEPQPQLAPRHSANKAGDSQWLLTPGEAAALSPEASGESQPPVETQVENQMELSGHDIRMKEFRRALVRGYSRADVDEFLTEVVKSFDACERVLMNHTTTAPPTALAETPPPAVEAPAAPEQSMLILKHSQRAAEEAIQQAEQAAEAIRTQALTQAEQMKQVAEAIRTEALSEVEQMKQAARLEAKALHAATLQAARNDAERGLLRARARARQVLQEAAEREQQAARVEAEAELRLAHIEQRLARKAQAVRQQAVTLDSLAGWLAEQDLRPEDPSANGAAVAHASAQARGASGDVLAFGR